jgi:hypothetical protein
VPTRGEREEGIKLRKEGRKAGNHEGRKAGRREGSKEARQEGRKEARKQGSKEARKQGRKEARKQGSKDGMKGEERTERDQSPHLVPQKKRRKEENQIRQIPHSSGMADPGAASSKSFFSIYRPTEAKIRPFYIESTVRTWAVVSLVLP